MATKSFLENVIVDDNAMKHLIRAKENMKKSKKEIENSINLLEQEMFGEEEACNIALFVFSKIREKLGTGVFYYINKKYNGLYELRESTFDKLWFTKVDSSYDNTEISLCIRERYDNIIIDDFIYKNKEKAQKVCDELNIEYYTKEIEKIKKELDSLNPIKIQEEMEVKRVALVNNYKNLKEKLDLIIGDKNVSS